MWPLQETIKSSLDVGNDYSKISKQCKENNAVVIVTVDGKKDTVSLTYKEYIRMKAKMKLLEILAEDHR